MPNKLGIGEVMEKIIDEGKNKFGSIKPSFYSRLLLTYEKRPTDKQIQIWEDEGGCLLRSTSTDKSYFGTFSFKKKLQYHLAQVWELIKHAGLKKAH